DAIDHQPKNWKYNCLSPAQLLDEPMALEPYWDTVGKLLKHQRSNLCALLLKNILETQRVTIKGPVPNQHAMLTAIYQDLPLRGKKMMAAEIQLQVNNNWAMQICMSYKQFVMVHYYVHISKKTSQCLEINKRLAIPRGSSIEFKQHSYLSPTRHAQPVLDKDHKLFSHFRNYLKIPKEEFTVPTLKNVRDALANAAAAHSILCHLHYFSPPPISLLTIIVKLHHPLLQSCGFS
ncbi:hypothetical protein PTTG_10324, partial [Puccinia triticina 1-1 BBBD Race 1]|uniref:Uncharacterized protein n=1 Tax=Puccinia triticina (isolate 1-1 / race 1 (BBBD)) TaxID=630390 RepID=A0A0C4FAT1_PUCT1